jgi:hypothetical protein
MTNTSGKISVTRVNAATKLTTAAADANEKAATRHATSSKQSRADYDKTTAKIADIVGTSAFFIELVLAVLAFGIATAKRAATIEIEVQQHNDTQGSTAVNQQAQQQQAQQQQAQQQQQHGVWNVAPPPFENAPPPPQAPPPPRKIGFFMDNDSSRVVEPQTVGSQTVGSQSVGSQTKTVDCLHCGTPYERKVTFQKYCAETCRIKAYEKRHNKVFGIKKT